MISCISYRKPMTMMRREKMMVQKLKEMRKTMMRRQKMVQKPANVTIWMQISFK